MFCGICNYSAATGVTQGIHPSYAIPDWSPEPEIIASSGLTARVLLQERKMQEIVRSERKQ